MRPSRCIGGWIPVVGALLAACSSKVDIPGGALLACSSAADCPSGRVCQNGLCRSAEALDTTPPDIVASAVQVLPGRIRATQTFTVRFEVTEALAADPVVSLPALGAAMACSSGAGLTWACSYTASGAENGGEGGVFLIDVRLRDRFGNETVRSGFGRVAFDFTPPAPTFATVAYLPGATNPLPAVQRATVGTVVRVVVSADELISTSPAPSLVARLGSVELPFSFVPGSLLENDAAFEAEVPPLEPDGAYTLAVTWSDDLGNEGTRSLPDRTVLIKTSPPSLAVDQDALVFVRSPWGNAADEDLGSYRIPAGPYFAVEPSEALTTAATLPRGSLMLGDGAVPSRAIVQSSGDPSALVLGVLRPDGGGLFPRQQLVSPDLATVWLVGVDDAGNRSPPVRLRHAELVATARPPASGASPHALGGTRHVGPARAQELGPAGPSADDVAGLDGRGAEVSSAGVWRDATWDGVAPDSREGSSMAADLARGRLVLFGGYRSDAGFFGDTWEWDGVNWARKAVAGPSAREHAPLAYDAARGRTVLFGGYDRSCLGDTWEWDGAVWTLATTAGPSPRFGHKMAYDAARGRLVLFGGEDLGEVPFGDTWEWDGAVWTLATTAGPSPRVWHAMAWDAARGRVVLFGGTNLGVMSGDTWEWDGTRWEQRATSGPARYMSTMAYDAARARVVLFGGNANGSANDTWEWDGTQWLQTAAVGPAVRYGHAMAFDAVRGRAVLFGGGSPAGYLGDTWEWDGASWHRRAAPGPAARFVQVMEYDAARGRVVLFGGFAGTFVGDTWEWDGASWTSVAVSGPTTPRNAATFDPARGRVVLMGCASYSPTDTCETWEWDGATWQLESNGGPPARTATALAYRSAAPGRTVLFGGLNQDGTGVHELADTWEWDGGSWGQAAVSGPPPRNSHAMASGPGSGRVLLFGGQDLGGALADTWEWDGAAWTLTTSAGPSARLGHAMALDAQRDRVVLFGGTTISAPGYALADTWEWSGTSWSQVASGGPPARVSHAMAYDAARRRLVLFGGSAGLSRLGDTWEWDAAADGRPALQLDASLRSTGVTAANVEGLRVRAFAGGSSTAGAGATLVGWAARGSAGSAGSWVPLPGATNGATPADLAERSRSILSWATTSGAEATRLLVERDHTLSFQVRPIGGAGPAPDGAVVSLDYIEVRVRYTTAP